MRFQDGDERLNRSQKHFLVGNDVETYTESLRIQHSYCQVRGPV